MYKKILGIALLISLSATMAFSQGLYDALRFSTQYYDGTARGVGMGNAMLSLGGDLGALSYNPAASGVYRYSEITMTGGLYSNISHSNYLGNTTKSNITRFNLSNAGYVGGFQTDLSSGLLNFNLAIATNQTNNFAFRTSASGLEATTSYLASLAANMPAGTSGNDMTIYEDNYSAPFYYANASWDQILAWNCGLIDTLQGGIPGFIGATENITNGGFIIPGSLKQNYYNERTGYVQDIILNASGNVDNIFFFGLNVTLQNIWFNEYSSYSETADSPNSFSMDAGGTGFTEFKTEYNQTTQGTGVKVQGGFIVRPVAGLSIGGSISTPTWMFLTDNWIRNMSGYTELYGHASVDSPVGKYSYRVVSPFKWSLGASYTINDFMAIGADYERVDYSKIYMTDDNGSKYEFSNSNNDISETFKAVNNVRAGIEMWPVSVLALRLGYNYYDTSDKTFDNSRHYASAGIGFRINGFFADIAYQQQCNYNNDVYSLYAGYGNNGTSLNAPSLSEKYLNWKLLLTLGFRF